MVSEIAERAGLNKTQSEAALVAFMETVVDAVAGTTASRVLTTMWAYSCRAAVGLMWTEATMFGWVYNQID